MRLIYKGVTVVIFFFGEASCFGVITTVFVCLLGEIPILLFPKFLDSFLTLLDFACNLPFRSVGANMSDFPASEKQYVWLN